jgi:hypothetical protein
MLYPNLIDFIRQGELDHLFDIMTSELLQRREECERAATQAFDEYRRRRDELEALRQRLLELHADQAGVNNGRAVEERRTTRLQIEAEIEKSTFDPKEAMRAVEASTRASRPAVLTNEVCEQVLERIGGDDETRTRGLCRDSEQETGNLLNTGAMGDTNSALRNPWEPLSHPSRTRDLCQFDLCLFT